VEGSRYIRIGRCRGMREIKNVKQNEPGILRRWFSDEYFDLVVWTDPNGERIGFQLCYDIDGHERALTFLKGSYRHTKIDTGDELPTANKTPILSADGVFDAGRILSRFIEASASIDKDMRAYVIAGIRAYRA
jgi:hypothetical protein